MEYDQEVAMYYQRKNAIATNNVGVVIIAIMSFLSLLMGYIGGAYATILVAYIIISIDWAMETDGYCRAFWTKFEDPDHRPMDEWRDDLIERGKIEE